LAEVVEILQFHTNRHITESRAERFEEGKYSRVKKFWFKINKQFQPVSHSVRLLCLFSIHNMRFWGQWLTEILSCQPWESIEIDVSFYGLHW